MTSSVKVTQDSVYICGPDILSSAETPAGSTAHSHTPWLEDDEIIDLIPYRHSAKLETFFICSCILTVGFAYLVIQWFPKYYFLARHVRVKTVDEASHFMIIKPDNANTFVKFQSTTAELSFNSTHESNRVVTGSSTQPPSPKTNAATTMSFSNLPETSHQYKNDPLNDNEPSFTGIPEHYIETMSSNRPKHHSFKSRNVDDNDNDNDSVEVEYFSSANNNVISIHESDSNYSDDDDCIGNPSVPIEDAEHPNIKTPLVAKPHSRSPSHLSRKKSKSLKSHPKGQLPPTSASPYSDHALFSDFSTDNDSSTRNPFAADSDAFHREFDPHATIRFFVYRQMRYVYNPANNTFMVTNGLVQPNEVIDISERIVYMGISIPEYKNNLAYFGPNVTDIKVDSVLSLLITHCLHFFYVFQLFSTVLWFYDTYYAYASAILGLTILSLAYDVYEMRSNLLELRRLAFFFEYVTVLRNGQEYTIKSLDLVPGDIYYLPKTSNFTIPCDSVLLEGACILNESMLTGESAAVPKLSLSIDSKSGKLLFRPLADTRCILYCGTRLVQSRGRVKAMVLNTGFSSKKGNLIRSILFAKKDNFKLYSDANKFVIGLFVIAIAASIYSATLFGTRGLSAGEVIKPSLDVITIVVPPALSSCVMLGTLFAVYRLKRSKIFCIHPSKVNVAGMLDCFVFDKTGTLTEDGLAVWAILSSEPKPADDAGFAASGGSKQALGQNMENSMSENSHQQHYIFKENKNLFEMDSIISSNSSSDLLSSSPESKHRSDLENDRDLISLKSNLSVGLAAHYQYKVPEMMAYAMATCHSLSHINHELSGDVVDLKMFESIGWTFFDPHTDDHHDAGAEQQQYGSANFAGDSSHDSESTSPAAPRLATLESLNLPSSVNPMIYHNIISSPVRPYTQLGLVKTYPFSSALQRMSVIVQDLKTKKIYSFLKGSPEIVNELCIHDARIPKDYQAQLDAYTSAGYRIIALAGKEIEMGGEQKNLAFEKLQNYNRDFIEKDFHFYGFLILQNKLKPETKSAISHLQDAEIRTIMCTGDNILTSIAVAKESRIIREDTPVYMGRLIVDHLTSEEHVEWIDAHDATRRIDSSLIGPPTLQGKPYALAITGKALNVIETTDPDLFERLLIRTNIFSRMSPDHKTHLIDSLKQMNYYVGMCGDGANDCGALTSADVGLSLSPEEASIAAPFTYRNKNIHIGACIKLIREGRAALSATFSVFRFMTLYAFVQLTTIMLLYYENTNLGDYQYLYVDLILIFPISVTMCYTGAHKKITKDRFIGSLLSPQMLITLALLVLIQLSFQLGIYRWMKMQPWYVKYYDPDAEEPDEEVATLTQENTVLFLATTFQYLGCAIAINTGKPFRKPAYTNYMFALLMLIYTGFQTYLLFAPSESVRALFELVDNMDSLWVLYAVTLICCAVTVFAEHFIFSSRVASALFLRITPGYNRERHVILRKKLNDLPCA